MAGMESFEAQLEERLEERREEIENNDVAQLKHDFRTMQSSFEAIHNVLKKKGLLKEDPYQYEERISEIDTPDDTQFMESERDTQLSVRLGQYESRLAYLADYFDVSLENLDLRRLKRIVKFLNYITWRNLSENASAPTTRALGEQIAKIKRSGDTLTANILNDAIRQLTNATRDALAILKRITAYQRERYKLELRRNVISEPSVPERPSEPEYEDAIRAAKKVFPKKMPNQPFARELLLEIFAENNSTDGEAVRQALLDELAPARKQSDQQPEQNTTKPMLLDAARTIAASSRSLEEAARKLSDNAGVLESRKLSFGEVLQQIWARLRGKDLDEHVYAVDFVDPNTNARETEEINLDQFVNSLNRRAKLYNGLISRSGAAWNKLQNNDEDSLLDFVTKDTQEMHSLVRRLESLDTFFRAETPREQRSQLHGLSAEVASINDNLSRARKKTRQYVAKVDERRQLEKLGISQDEL